MTNSSLWEQENQEKLRDDYFYRCAHGIQNDYVYPIRRIICEGCGNIFYTMVPVKKYCNERCCYLGFWKHKREKRLTMRKDTVCKTCETLLRQNVPMPYIAVMPVGRRHTDKVLRLMVSAQNDHLPLSVTFEEPINYSKVSNWHLGIRKNQMLKLIQIG